ncbi:MAG: hypothetical protein GEU96_21605, partial [Propionibacteriales bacterium]|nr:hypothetical protein [Propionibacteriales bacterium]
MFESSTIGRMPPGPGLATLLADVDPGGLDADQTLVLLAAVDRMQSWCEAARFDALAHYADLHAVVPESMIPGAT